MDYTVHGIPQARILRWVAFPFSRGSSQFRDRTQVSALQAGSLPAEPQGKPKNTGVGSLSLLQRIFPTQESNWGLLCCRWILYQLSHQGSPRILERVGYPFSSGSSRPRNRTGEARVRIKSGAESLLWFPQEGAGPMRVARGPLGIPLLSMPGPKTLCGVGART